MRVCSMPGCQTTAGCQCNNPVPITLQPRHSMPVYLPVPWSGMVTIAILDSDGNTTIKVDQPRPE